MKISEAKSIEKGYFFLIRIKIISTTIFLAIKYAHEGEHRISFTLRA